MNIEFTGRGTDVTDSLKQFTTDKLKKMSRFIDNIMEVNVTFSVEKHRHTAEIMIKAGQDRLVAKETTNDMYGSISGALDKLEKQAKKLKTRLAKKRKDGPSPTMPAPTGSAVQETELVQLSVTHFKPMTVEEAVIELESGVQPYVIFRNHEKSEELTVLIRRDDNSIGIVSLS